MSCLPLNYIISVFLHNSTDDERKSKNNSLQVKGKIAGIIVFIAYTLMFFVVKFFPYSLTMYGMEVMFYFFAISSFIFCAFVWRFLPETYSKTLNDIHNYFVRK